MILGLSFRAEVLGAGELFAVDLGNAPWVGFVLDPGLAGTDEDFEREGELTAAELGPGFGDELAVVLGPALGEEFAELGPGIGEELAGLVPGLGQEFAELGPGLGEEFAELGPGLGELL